MVPVVIACDLARKFEGFYAAPYLCPAGVATIGYGTTRYPGGLLVSLADNPVDRDTAEKYLIHEMEKCYRQALVVTPSLIDCKPGQQAAIIDFIYNLGIGRYQASTLKKRIQSGDLDDVPTQLRKWTRGGGRILRGLVLRREAEIVLWLR